MSAGPSQAVASLNLFAALHMSLATTLRYLEGHNTDSKKDHFHPLLWDPHGCIG
jgi:hypothetical protein